MNHGLTSRHVTINSDDDEEEELIEPLSGNPFFHVTLSKTAVENPHRLAMPKEGAEILPKKEVETTLSRGQKSWVVTYMGKGKNPRFNNLRWRKFVIDNSLNISDVCLFEVMECSHSAVTLKVQVLRGHFPSALQNNTSHKTKTNGSRENPIVIG